LATSDKIAQKQNETQASDARVSLAFLLAIGFKNSGRVGFDGKYVVV